MIAQLRKGRAANFATIFQIARTSVEGVSFEKDGAEPFILPDPRNRIRWFNVAKSREFAFILGGARGKGFRYRFQEIMLQTQCARALAR